MKETLNRIDEEVDSGYFQKSLLEEFFEYCKGGNLIKAKQLIEDKNASINIARDLPDVNNPVNLSETFDFTKEFDITIADGEKRKRTPLLAATESGNMDLVKYLIDDLEIDVNQKSTCDVAPLFLAAQQGNYDMVEFLLSQKDIEVDILNDTDDTPLMTSLYNRNTQIALLLIDKGADVEAIDSSGNSCLSYSYMGDKPIKENDKEKFDDLRNLLITPKVVNLVGLNGDIALLGSVGFYNEDGNDFSNIKNVKRLIDNGANINIGDHKKRNSLMIATCLGEFEIAQLLIENEIDLHAKDDMDNKYTALKLAIQYKKFDVASLIINKLYHVLNGDLALLKESLDYAIPIDDINASALFLLTLKIPSSIVAYELLSKIYPGNIGSENPNPYYAYFSPEVVTRTLYQSYLDGGNNYNIRDAKIHKDYSQLRVLGREIDKLLNNENATKPYRFEFEKDAYKGQSELLFLDLAESISTNIFNKVKEHLKDVDQNIAKKVLKKVSKRVALNSAALIFDHQNKIEEINNGVNKILQNNLELLRNIFMANGRKDLGAQNIPSEMWMSILSFVNIDKEKDLSLDNVFRIYPHELCLGVNLGLSQENSLGQDMLNEVGMIAHGVLKGAAIDSSKSCQESLTAYAKTRIGEGFEDKIRRKALNPQGFADYLTSDSAQDDAGKKMIDRFIENAKKHEEVNEVGDLSSDGNDRIISTVNHFFVALQVAITSLNHKYFPGSSKEILDSNKAKEGNLKKIQDGAIDRAEELVKELPGSLKTEMCYLKKINASKGTVVKGRSDKGKDRAPDDDPKKASSKKSRVEGFFSNQPSSSLSVSGASSSLDTQKESSNKSQKRKR